MSVCTKIVYASVWWIMETPKSPSMQIKCQTLQNVEVGHYEKKKKCTVYQLLLTLSLPALFSILTVFRIASLNWK